MIGLLIFFLYCLVVILLVFIYYLCDICTEYRSKINELSSDVNKYFNLWSKCHADFEALKDKLEVVKTNTMSCSKPAMKGTVIKCGFYKCIVKWDDGRKEKLFKHQVNDLILSGVLKVGTNKNINIHGPQI